MPVLFSAFFLELHSVYLTVPTPVLGIKARTTCPLLGEVIYDNNLLL